MEDRPVVVIFQLLLWILCSNLFTSKPGDHKKVNPMGTLSRVLTNNLKAPSPFWMAVASSSSRSELSPPTYKLSSSQWQCSLCHCSSLIFSNCSTGTMPSNSTSTMFRGRWVILFNGSSESFKMLIKRHYLLQWV